jgi:hypothetical protein
MNSGGQDNVGWLVYSCDILSVLKKNTKESEIYSTSVINSHTSPTVNFFQAWWAECCSEYDAKSKNDKMSTVMWYNHDITMCNPPTLDCLALMLDMLEQLCFQLCFLEILGNRMYDQSMTEFGHHRSQRWTFCGVWAIYNQQPTPHNHGLSYAKNKRKPYIANYIPWQKEALGFFESPWLMKFTIWVETRLFILCELVITEMFLWNEILNFTALLCVVSQRLTESLHEKRFIWVGIHINFCIWVLVETNYNT